MPDGQPPQLPEQLYSARHRDLAGRTVEPWIRRAILLACGVVAVAALLGLFGQQPSTSRATSSAASLELRAPERVRGGLIFQARFDIHATSRLAQPTLQLERGWFDSMSVNSIEPQPESESSVDDHVDLELDSMSAGETRSVWIYFQANPNNVGRQGQRVVLADGDRQLVRIDRSLLVLP